MKDKIKKLRLIPPSILAENEICEAEEQAWCDMIEFILPTLSEAIVNDSARDGSNVNVASVFNDLSDWFEMVQPFLSKQFVVRCAIDDEFLELMGSN